MKMCQQPLLGWGGGGRRGYQPKVLAAQKGRKLASLIFLQRTHEMQLISQFHPFGTWTEEADVACRS